jgi:hypothetical protein
VAQLLRRSRHSGTARSTAADLTRAESRGTRQHEEGRTRRGNSGGLDRPHVVCTCRRKLWAQAVLTGWAGTVDMGWVQSGAQPFSKYSNFAPILKYTTTTILMSINVQTWHGDRTDYSKHFSHWVHLQFPT